jgi:hypothetical protein
LAHALTVFGLTLGPEQPTQLRRQLSGLFGQSPSRPALNLPVGQLRLEFGVRDHPVAGDLLEAKVQVGILKIVLLDPAAEHQAHQLGGGTGGIVS